MSGRARDLEERLRPVAGERAHAGAEAGGEDHRSPAASCGGLRCRASTAGSGAGTWAATKAARGASDGVGEVARQVRPDAGEVGEVARLAVAAAEAGEEAEDLQVALGGEQAARRR